MKRKLLFSGAILFCTITVAQEPMEKRTTPSNNAGNRLLQFNMDMPVGTNGEQFVSGTVDIPVLQNVAIRLERTYTRFGTQEQVTGGMALKYFMKENLYTVGGTEVLYNLQSGIAAPDRVMTRLNLGVGHEVKPNLFLELGYKPGIGNTAPNILQGPIFNNPNSFSLKAKF